MTSRIEKLAKVLIGYSLDIKPGETLVIRSSAAAQELNLAVYREAVKAGAHVQFMSGLPGGRDIFFKYANDEQLEYVSPINKMVMETFDANLYIEAPSNTRELAAADPKRQAKVAKANRVLSEIFQRRTAAGEYKWSYTLFPTDALAQEADMSLDDYQEFVYTAGLLDEEDPVAAWKEASKETFRYAKWLEGRDKVVIKGPNVDLTMSIKGRKFEASSGHENFPDGEIFTGPVEDSVNGYIRYSYPAIQNAREVEDIELWFENGKVVKENASKGLEFLTETLNTDEGARYLGELGIGTNYNIQRFTKHMLFDEKIGGTIHLAVGMSYPETGGKNVSSIHWDMLCDMAEGEITVDGELMYKNGKFVI